MLGLALLLAAAAAAADAFVGSEEALPCSVVSADSGRPCTRRLDTLARNASPAEMAARCRDMCAALRECGRSDRTIAELLREVGHEQAALRAIRPREETVRLFGGCGGLLGMVAGSVLVVALTKDAFEYSDWGWPVSFGFAGCLAGGVLGWPCASLGAAQSEIHLAVHRGRVNDLVRRVNRAIALPS